MSKYPKAKMPDYGDGPEPCEDCAYRDKRIAVLEEEVKDAVRLLDMAHEAACLNNNYRFAKTLEVFLNRSEEGADE